MDLISHIIVVVLTIMSLSMGILLFSLRIQTTASLKNYKISRKVVAYVFLTLGFVNLIKLFVGNSDIKQDALDIQIMSMSYIIVASLQSLLLTYSQVVLIDAYYVTTKKVILQLLPILSLSILTIVSFISENTLFFNSSLFIFSLFYTYQLIAYTLLYFRKEKKFKTDSQNYFSEDEVQRIKWIRLAFLFSLSIGIWAFLIVVFPTNRILEISFSFACIIFYFYFGVCYINYTIFYNVLEPIIAPVEDLTPTYVSTDGNDTTYDLSQKLEQWVSNKLYTKTGITINELADQLQTNRTYLSYYINTIENTNFNKWLNTLRIEEAKMHLINSPELSLSELSDKLGYSDQSCFSRQFKIITGHAPSAWKDKNVD